MDYHYPWNNLISRWKFGQQPALARYAAHWMLQDARIQAAINAADVLVPIPLSKERIRERGYNQAALLAQAFKSHKHQLHCLARTHHAMAQSGSTRAQRLRNLRNAFTIDTAQRHHIQGKKVLLIDDVMTTGATLTAASHCLLQAGARQIQVLCMARTP